jgi:hypothetical protein
MSGSGARPPRRHDQYVRVATAVQATPKAGATAGPRARRAHRRAARPRRAAAVRSRARTPSRRRSRQQVHRREVTGIGLGGDGRRARDRRFGVFQRPPSLLTAAPDKERVTAVRRDFPPGSPQVQPPFALVRDLHPIVEYAAQRHACTDVPVPLLPSQVGLRSEPCTVRRWPCDHVAWRHGTPAGSAPDRHRHQEDGEPPVLPGLSKLLADPFRETPTYPRAGRCDRRRRAPGRRSQPRA